MKNGALPASTSQRPSAIIVGAAEFLDNIARHDTIATAEMLGVPWLFNNLAIVFHSRVDLIARVDIAEAGEYHLFVRSHGSEGNSFKIAVGLQVTTASFGNAPLGLRHAGTFELPKGLVDIRLTRIVGSPAFDVLILTKDPVFKEEQLLSCQLPPEVELLREYRVQGGTVKFGDVDGDGRMDMLVLGKAFAAAVYNNDGKLLWDYQPPEEGADLRCHEAPGSIWDIDQDGFGEVIHWRQEGGQEWLVIAEGRTGRIKKKTPWPAPPMPHPYYNFRTAIGHLTPGYPSNILTFTDAGGTIAVHIFDADLNLLWHHTEACKKDHLGHYVYPIDISGDGLDEVVIGSVVLDSKGKVLWHLLDEFPDHHDHADSYRFADIDGDGKLEILAPWSEVGVLVLKAETGKLLWQHPAEHVQQLEFGSFLEGVPAPQVAATARFYGRREVREPYLSGQVHWFDAKGNFVGKWPANPINGNPDFVKGDWYGDGQEQLFWYRFKMNAEGKGELFFDQPVYHMFDFAGRGAEEVIVVGRDVVKVYGCRHVTHRKVVHDIEYLRNKIANHTHY